MNPSENSTTEPQSDASSPQRDSDAPDGGKPREHGGPKGPEPTRYGDWERNGRCYDF